MATDMPEAGDQRASEMPEASTLGSPLPKLEISLNSAIMPVTVPSNPEQRTGGGGEGEGRVLRSRRVRAARMRSQQDLLDVFASRRNVPTAVASNPPAGPESTWRGPGLLLARVQSGETCCRSRSEAERTQDNWNHLYSAVSRDATPRVINGANATMLLMVSPKALLHRRQLEGVPERRSSARRPLPVVTSSRRRRRFQTDGPRRLDPPCSAPVAAFRSWSRRCRQTSHRPIRAIFPC